MEEVVELDAAGLREACSQWTRQVERRRQVVLELANVMLKHIKAEAAAL